MGPTRFMNMWLFYCKVLDVPARPDGNGNGDGWGWVMRSLRYYNKLKPLHSKKRGLNPFQHLAALLDQSHFNGFVVMTVTKGVSLVGPQVCFETLTKRETDGPPLDWSWSWSCGRRER